MGRAAGVSVVIGAAVVSTVAAAATAVAAMHMPALALTGLRSCPPALCSPSLLYVIQVPVKE